jgi:drug/metabolite transporter (DMT)-like permease
MLSELKFEPGERKRGLIALVLSVIALTLSPLFVRWAAAPGNMTSFYRMWIAAVVLTPFFIGYLRKNGWPDARAFIFPVAAGLFSSIDHALWSTAIERTTVANATLLNNISPLWVAIFAMVVWGERLVGRFWGGLLAILLGASLVLGSTILLRPDFSQGDFLAILSSFSYAAFFIFTQKGRMKMATVPALWTMLVTAAICLLVTTQWMGIPISGYSPSTYFIFLTAGLLSQLGGYFLLTFTLGRLPASIVTPTMVAQPVLTALLAIPLMRENLLPLQAIGGILTLGGIYIIHQARK